MIDCRRAETPGAAAVPRVWALLGRRYGDNAQIEALAEDLDVLVQSFRLDYNVLRELPNSALGASLVSLASPLPFKPPWPDLVIAIGRRSVPVARWIRMQSGGRTRLVQLGRPRISSSHFDLVITTPQYALPPSANIIELTLPYQSSLKSATAVAPAPPDGPVLAILGGNSWSLKVSAETVDELARVAHRIAGELGRPLVATTSPRTPPDLGIRLGEQLGPDVPLYDWAREKGLRNPYREYLSAAAWIVITGDSVSGLADAVWTGRPVSIVSVPEQPLLHRLRSRGGAVTRGWLRRGANLGIGASPPDMEALYEALVSSGIARRTETGMLEITSGRAHLEAQRRAVVEQVRGLMPVNFRHERYV